MIRIWRHVWGQMQGQLGASLQAKKAGGGLGILDMEKLYRALRLRWLWHEWVSPNKPSVGLPPPSDGQDHQLFTTASDITREIATVPNSGFLLGWVARVIRTLPPSSSHPHAEKNRTVAHSSWWYLDCRFQNRAVLAPPFRGIRQVMAANSVNSSHSRCWRLDYMEADHEWSILAPLHATLSLWEYGIHRMGGLKGSLGHLGTSEVFFFVLCPLFKTASGLLIPLTREVGLISRFASYAKPPRRRWHTCSSTADTQNEFEQTWQIGLKMLVSSSPRGRHRMWITPGYTSRSKLACLSKASDRLLAPCAGVRD